MPCSYFDFSQTYVGIGMICPIQVRSSPDRLHPHLRCPGRAPSGGGAGDVLPGVRGHPLVRHHVAHHLQEAG